MAIKSSSYGTCQQCKALNMAHRTTCYRCGTAITPTASRGLNGQSAAQTQYQPQPGQFPPPGQQPGTPPGGYPQQG